MSEEVTIHAGRDMHTQPEERIFLDVLSNCTQEYQSRLGLQRLHGIQGLNAT